MRRDRWKKQEKSLAKRLGGRVQKNSGATPFQKGDVRSRVFLAECKCTDKDQFILKSDMLDKIEQEAALDGRQPLVELDLNGRKWIMLQPVMFETMLRKSF